MIASDPAFIFVIKLALNQTLGLVASSTTVSRAVSSRGLRGSASDGTSGAQRQRRGVPSKAAANMAEEEGLDSGVHGTVLAGRTPARGRPTRVRDLEDLPNSMADRPELDDFWLTVRLSASLLGCALLLLLRVPILQGLGWFVGCVTALC